jgi:dethiobiotin synthetase
VSVWVVSGTDTEVGKTVTTAAMTAVIAASGRSVCVVKPVQTGAGPGEPGDLDEVRRLAGPVATREVVRLPDPLSPTAAARSAGVPLPSVADHARTVIELIPDFDVVLVEGAGGLLVPFDAAGGTIADVAGQIAAAGADVQTVIVARAGLGTLNHSALSVEALRHRGLRCAGVVIGSWPSPPDLAMLHNLADLPAVTGVSIIGRIPAGAPQQNPKRFREQAPAWFTFGESLPW